MKVGLSIALNPHKKESAPEIVCLKERWMLYVRKAIKGNNQVLNNAVAKTTIVVLKGQGGNLFNLLERKLYKSQYL